MSTHQARKFQIISASPKKSFDSWLLHCYQRWYHQHTQQVLAICHYQFIYIYILLSVDPLKNLVDGGIYPDDNTKPLEHA